jgi:invasion protein IalB
LAQEGVKPEQTVFDNWLYSCESGACQSILSLAGEEGGEVVLSWAFVHDPKSDRISMLVTLPLGVALAPGLRLDVSTGQHLDIPFQVCDGQGCRAVAVADASLMAGLAAAEEVSFRYIPYGSQGATAVRAPMKGFSKAIARLKASKG